MKAWFESRTIWVNLMGLVAMAALYFFDVTISSEDQVAAAGALYALVNIALRLATDTAVVAPKVSK